MSQLPVVNQPVHRSGALMEHLSRRIRLRSEAVLAPLGLRHRHLVALTVLGQHGAMTQQVVASTLEMDSTNVVGLLNDLEKDGLIERRRSPEDRRRHVVDVTAAGHELLAKVEFLMATVEDDVFAPLTGAQREQLYELLQLAATGDPCDEGPSMASTCMEATRETQ